VKDKQTSGERGKVDANNPLRHERRNTLSKMHHLEPLRFGRYEPGSDLAERFVLRRLPFEPKPTNVDQRRHKFQNDLIDDRRGSRATLSNSTSALACTAAA